MNGNDGYRENTKIYPIIETSMPLSDQTFLSLYISTYSTTPYPCAFPRTMAGKAYKTGVFRHLHLIL
jgi:hypothetical protein